MRAYLSAQAIFDNSLPKSTRPGEGYLSATGASFYFQITPLSFSHSFLETVHYAPFGLASILATRLKASVHYYFLRHKIEELNASRPVPARPVVYSS